MKSSTNITIVCISIIYEEYNVTNLKYELPLLNVGNYSRNRLLFETVTKESAPVNAH